MQDELVTFHVIEPGRSSRPTLFEVSMIVEPDTRSGLQDCDEEIQRQAMGKTARQSLTVLGQPVQSAAWQHVPSTYLVCADDRGTPAGLQREFAARAGSVVEVDAGHHPFLSQPDAVRDLILAVTATRGG